MPLVNTQGSMASAHCTALRFNFLQSNRGNNIMEIRTNNVPRLLKYGYEMPENLRTEFDYIEEEDFATHDFFIFKGQWYDLAEFMRCDSEHFKGWDGYASDSYFSGVLVRILDDERVVVGQYFS